jgi:hypothetical protein
VIEQQRSELALKVSLSDTAARRSADLGKNQAKLPAAETIGASSTIGNSAKARAAKRGGGTGKGAMLFVALVSAAIAGGSAYFFARARALEPAGSAAPAAPSVITASVQIVPSEARVTTRDGVVPVVAGVATLRGQAGETLSVTVQRGAVTKTFAVSLGSDGIATPGRLVLE